MNFNYRKFKVEIKNLKFTSDEGLIYPKTAIVTFLDEFGGQSSVELFGHMDSGEIYRKIENNEVITLDHCYITKFSLSVYREKHKMDEKARVSIREFSAHHAFFDTKSGLDFSFAEFSKGDVHFEYSHFANGIVNFSSAIFKNGHVNFSNALFRDGDVDFSNVHFGNGDVLFKNSVFFDGKKDFQYADFGEGLTSFANVEFNSGEVSFINTQFGDGQVSFKIARFISGKVDFHFARFESGDISFERTEFGDCKVDFRTVEFGDGRINFNRATFGKGDVSFEASQMNSGRFSMKRVNFGEGVKNFELVEYDHSELILDNSDFGTGNLSFYNSRIGKLNLKSCHLDHYLDLRVSKCEYIDLSDTIARDIIDLQPYDFDVNLKVLNLTGMRLLGRIFIDWKRNRVEKLIRNQEHTSLRQKSEQFRLLKENYQLTGKYEDEDKAYVEFKRSEALADLQEAVAENPLSRIWVWPRFAIQWLIFEKMGKYATAPLRVLLSMLVAYTLFSLLYYVLMLFSDSSIYSSIGDPDKLGPLAVSFYHSAITFLTIGYGDYYPSGFIRVLSGLEGFMGLFMMSYFTVAFVRKILR